MRGRIRTLLVASALALGACARAPVAPVEADAGIPAQRLAEGVYRVPGHYAPPRQPDGNSVLLAGPDALLVVDTGRHAAHSDAVLAAATALRRPISHVLNTHWHLDHIGGNARLRAAHPGLRVIASPAIHAARDGFLADYAGQLRELLAAPPAGVDADALREELARIDGAAALLPDEVLDAPREAVLAGRRVRLGLARDAVTGGDAWLYDHDSGVLVAGDLVTLPAPFFDTACPDRWAAALDTLAAQPFRQLVPGHGAPMDRDAFATWRRGYDALRACARSAAPAQACREGWLRDAGPLLPDDAARRQAGALLDYYLSQVLRGPAALRHCADAGEREAARAQAPR